MKNITVKANITIRQAMKILDKTGDKCLVVVDNKNKILGTLTDGDLRRSILRGTSFQEDISTSFNAKPKFLFQNSYNTEEAIELLRAYKLDLIPIIDKNHILVDYMTWSKMDSEYQSNNLLKDVPVVIMAGGKGTRLEPFTKVLPKPLIPINDKPIIKHIIERFTEIGSSNFYLTVNYKSKILKAYFDDLELDYKVKFIDENEPLGTAGSLRYLKGKMKESFFITNCDIIIKSNYLSMYDFHKKGGYDITLVASTKEYIIPYGACELNEEGHLSHINEKPKYDFLINTGLYILNPDIIDIIPKNKFYHITELIEDAKNKGKKVGVYPVDDDAWIDIGQWAEYKKSLKLL